MKKIRVNKKNCSGCKLCIMNCSFSHFNVTSPHLSNVKIIGSETHAEFVPTLCHQCEGRFCIKSCPSDALTINEVTGAIQIDREKCNFCGQCVGACPYHAIYISKNPAGEDYLMICDLCGGDPQCAKYCRLAAIVYK